MSKQQAAAGFLLQFLDAGSARSHDDVLLGNLRIGAVDGVSGLRSQPLTKIIGQLGLQAAGTDSGLRGVVGRLKHTSGVGSQAES